MAAYLQCIATGDIVTSLPWSYRRAVAYVELYMWHWRNRGTMLMLVLSCSPCSTLSFACPLFSFV